jgi:hypothetical protein
MKDSGKILKEMEWENNYGKMDPYMRAIGKIIWLTDMDVSSMPMEMSTKVNGGKIKPME